MIFKTESRLGRFSRPAVFRALRALLTPAFAFSTVAALTASHAEAYIPSSRTISSRLAKNSGKGAFVIEQEVQFRSLAEPITLRERWTVENGETMRLSVFAPKSSKDAAKFEALYREGKRTAPDLIGSLKTTNVGGEFIESFQHFRSGKGFLDALVRSRIVPGSFLRERPRPTKADKVVHQPEPYVRLGRTGGVVAWVFGEPSPIESSKLNAQVWIGQDEFLLRRLRFPSQAEMTATNFISSPGSLVFPKERTVTWDNNTVVIRVLSVKPAPAGSAAQALAANSLTAADAKSAKLPEQPQVKEFYSRFR